MCLLCNNFITFKTCCVSIRQTVSWQRRTATFQPVGGDNNGGAASSAARRLFLCIVIENHKDGYESEGTSVFVVCLFSH